MFTVRKPKPYRFKPRYYDEQKEIYEKRERQIRKELNMYDGSTSAYAYTPYIKGQMHAGFRNARKMQKKSNTRLITIILILVVLSYFIFYV